MTTQIRKRHHPAVACVVAGGLLLSTVAPVYAAPTTIKPPINPYPTVFELQTKHNDTMIVDSTLAPPVNPLKIRKRKESTTTHATSTSSQRFNFTPTTTTTTKSIHSSGKKNSTRSSARTSARHPAH